MTAGSGRTGVARSALAVVAGFMVTAALSLGTDTLLHTAGVYPGWGKPMVDRLFGVAVAYRIVFTVLGGLTTARLAPRAPMAHVWSLGALGVVAATAGAIATWNQGPVFGPHWYPVVLIVVALPCVWLGGRLGTR